METLLFTVTNELCFDQRMIRICNSLAGAGYKVTLIGTRNGTSPPLAKRPFDQKRLRIIFKKGPGFYAEYNFRLFFYLLFKKADAICCIDLDTILPVWLASKIKGTRKAYDAHEYFSEQKEIISRSRVHKIWKWIERHFVPRFKNGYTVSESIATAFKKEYGVSYDVIRNLPLLKPLQSPAAVTEKILLYQGAVNEARGFEMLIPAMKNIPARLDIYGEGNFMEQAKKIIETNNLQDKVLLKGKWLPEQLEGMTTNVYAGLNLVENTGLNQYYSLANKFFDYMHHGLPQVTMNYPEYKKINDEYETAVLIDDLQPGTITSAINRLLLDGALYQRLQQQCMKARAVLNWQHEEKKLLDFYDILFCRKAGETEKTV